MRTILIVAFVLMVAGCDQTLTAPLQPAAIETFSGGHFECFDGSCHFFGIAINRGTGCADQVRGQTTIRLPDDREFARIEWTLQASRIVSPGHTFGFQQSIGRDSFPTERRIETTFAWRDVPCR